MRHFFILGTNPVLSTAEIIALLDSRHFTVTETYKQALIVDELSGHTLDTKALMSRLGGTVKIGTVIAEDVPVHPQPLEEIMLKQLNGRIINEKNATFGFSVYSLESDKPADHAVKIADRFRNVGMRIKRQMKDAGCSTRWVKVQTGAALTSVAVGKNQMIDYGAEFVLLTKGDTMLVGKTAVVQPFEEFSMVDYGRPERDMQQGMLPPKLARMLINLLQVSRELTEVTLLDPFCGSGTVLTEALQMGFPNLYGTDKNAAAVAGTEKNIAWVKEKGMIKVDTGNVKLIASDARDLGKHIAPGTLDGVACELYLGPVRTGTETRGALQKRLDELTKLYYECLSAWKPLLKPGAPVVFAMPVYILGIEKHGINAKEFEKLGFRSESLLPAPVLNRLGTPETKNHGLLYGRNDQRVWREIIRFRCSE